MKYLGISGIGNISGAANPCPRDFNAIPLLAYWDIYKNYYSNKQEGNGYFVHTTPAIVTAATTPIAARLMTQSGLDYNILAPATAVLANAGDIIEIDYPTNCPELTNLGQIATSLASVMDVLATCAINIEWSETAKRVTCIVSAGGNAKTIQISATAHPYVLNQGASFALTSFPLTNM